MKDFIDLLIMGIVAYLIIKGSYKFITGKVRWAFLDKSAVAHRESMRYKNTIYADEFFSMEGVLSGRGFAGEGIYVFTNMDNKKTYVGQSVNVLRRVKQHLTGRGSEDLYYDLERENKFTIRFVTLKESRFSSLNALEKHYIHKHNSYYGGYNKTQGNS